MKCKSCTNDVPPKFSHAIKTNICPFCGEEIMDSELQSALADLQVAMEASEQYQEEIHDWLKCNYGLVPELGTVTFSVHQEVLEKLEDANAKIVDLQEQLSNVKPVPKSGKLATASNRLPSEIAKDKEGNALEGEQLADAETTNKFFKAAGAKAPVDAASHYRNMVKQIKEKGSTGLMSEGGAAGVITPEMLAAADQVDASEYQELFDSGPVNSAVDSDYDDDSDIPAVALQMMHSAKGKQGDYNARDVAKLQELQRKASNAGRAMSREGGVGLIRR